MTRHLQRWRVRPAIATAVLIMAAACASPSEEFDRAAAQLALERAVAMGTTYQHVVYRRGGDGRRLNVYLDGDGTPQLGGHPAADPTPRNPLMLRLLAIDPGPAVYIGRPCYHGAVEGCTQALWTTARYGEPVVASLIAAIRKVAQEGGHPDIVLFGYSGGGVLAMLIAERLPETRAVVTVAANLDVERWAAHHGGHRLGGSLDPAQRPPPAAGVVQRHYIGSRDTVVPPALLTAASQRLGSTAIVVDGFDHACCWERIWPDILANVDRALAAGSPATGSTRGSARRS